MTQEELQEVARRRPFAPFRLTVSTGATYDVRHPDLIMVGRRSAVIGLVNEPSGTAYDRFVSVDLMHFVSIEELPTPSASTGGAA